MFHFEHQTTLLQRILIEKYLVMIDIASAEALHGKEPSDCGQIRLD